MTVSVYKHVIGAVRGLVASERKQYPSSDHASSDDSDVFTKMRKLSNGYFAGQSISMDALRNLRDSLADLEDAIPTPDSGLTCVSEETLPISGRLSPKRLRSESMDSNEMQRPAKRLREEPANSEFGRAPVFPFEIVELIARHIDDKKSLRNLLLCNSQYLEFCRSIYLARIVGFKETKNSRVVHVTDLEAMKALVIWDLRPEESQKIHLRVTCLSTEIPVLTSFLTTRTQSNRSLCSISITLRSSAALDIAPLLKSAARNEVVDFELQRSILDWSQPLQAISFSASFDVQSVLCKSSISELRFSDVDLSPPEVQNLLRLSLANLNIHTLVLKRCGKHRILAGLKMPLLRDFNVSIDYGQGGILSFISHHPALQYVDIYGAPEKMIEPLYPSRPHLTNLKGLGGSLFIAEQLLSRGETHPLLRNLSIHSDVDAADVEDSVEGQQYVASYERRVFKLAKEAMQLDYLELDVLSPTPCDLPVELALPLVQELHLSYMRCSSCFTLTAEDVVRTARQKLDFCPNVLRLDIIQPFSFDETVLRQLFQETNPSLSRRTIQVNCLNTCFEIGSL